MEPLTMLGLLTALTVKHFFADFLYQPPYQWQNKGTYGHPGGLLHAGQHALATFFILRFFGYEWAALGLAALEGAIHYHVDWFKMAYNKKKGWGPQTHEQFWWLLGADQLAHSLTYLGIAYALTI